MSEPKVNETKPSETKQKKMVSRNVAVALGLVCIVLIAFIAYFTITGISAQNSYNNLQNQNKQLQTWLDGNETLVTQIQANNTNLQNEIDSLNSNVTRLQNQMNNLTDILTLHQSTVWVYNQTVSQPINSSTNWTFPASYAGYLLIEVDVPPLFDNGIMVIDTGIVEGIYVRVNYTFGYQPYDSRAALGGIGMTAYFQVMPTNIGITVGNTNILGITKDNATETVTITYYY
jgi:cell division protein FtsB